MELGYQSEQVYIFCFPLCIVILNTFDTQMNSIQTDSHWKTASTDIHLRTFHLVLRIGIALVTNFFFQANKNTELIFLGQKFALFELKMVISEIMMKFRLEPVTTMEEVTIKCDIVLRTKDPVRIRFVSR